MLDEAAASGDLSTGLLLVRIVQISRQPHKAFSHPLLTLHQAAHNCLQVPAAAEQLTRLTDSLEEMHQGMLTLGTMAPAVDMETFDHACIDLTEDNDMDEAPAAGRCACGCVHCFFMYQNACRFCSDTVCL